MKQFLLSFFLVLFVSFITAQIPTCGELLFSEYVEGSSSNKYLEIFNPTDVDVDLSDYEIELYTNGSTTANASIELAGILAFGGSYVIANPSANIWTGTPDDYSGSVINFNGNDALTLLKNGVIIDVIGEIGSSVDFAINVTLIRNADVQDGSTTYDETQWTVESQNYVDDLGSHLYDGCLPLEVEVLLSCQNDSLKIDLIYLGGGATGDCVLTDVDAIEMLEYTLDGSEIIGGIMETWVSGEFIGVPSDHSLFISVTSCDYIDIILDGDFYDYPCGPSCSDGIQNGNETGIDCGGPQCAPCCTPSGEFSLYFDGVDNDIQDLDAIGMGSEFTVELWIKPGSTQLSYAQPIGYRHLSVSSWTLQANNNSDTNWRYAVAHGGAFYFVYFDLIVDTWQHVALTLSATDMKVFVDGVEVGTTARTIDINYIGTEVLDIASHETLNRFFNGDMDEIRIWDHARSDAEILDNHDKIVDPNSSGLLIYYDFDDILAGDLFDLTGNGHDGTLNNCTLPDDINCGVELDDPCIDPGNYSLDFDGVDDQVDVEGLELNAWTIEAWVYPTSIAGYSTIYANSDQGVFLQDGKINYFKTGIGDVLVGSTTLPSDVWNHIAVSYDVNGLNMYLNGVAEGYSGDSGLELPNDDFYIGGHDGIEYFEGQIDELRIWNVARSASDILASKDNYLYGTEPNLEVYYNFNDGISSTLTDITSAPLNGTLMNMSDDDWICSLLLNAPSATCDDGIQNGDETNVDCGGTTCAECCADPTDFVASDIAGDQANISWTPNSSCVTNSEYWVQTIGGATPTIGTGTSIDCNPTFPILVDGLSPTTEYNVYVYQDCDGQGISGPTSLGSFTTCPSAFEWTGAEDNLWSNVNNWCQGVLPGVGDAVNIPNGVTNTPSVDLAEVIINTLILDSDMTIQESSTFIVNGQSTYRANVDNYGIWEPQQIGNQIYNGDERIFTNHSTGVINISGSSTALRLYGSDFINDGEINISNVTNGIYANNGVPGGNGTFTNNGTLNISDITGTGEGIRLTKHNIWNSNNAGYPSGLTNNGTINITNVLRSIHNDYGFFINNSTVNIEGSTYDVYNFGDFNNSGIINSDIGISGTDFFYFDFENTGTITVNEDNALLVSFNVPWTNEGILQGQGLMAGDMTNTGTLIPGLSPGIITYDDAFTNTGTIEFEVLGLGGAGETDGHDQLVFNTDQNTLGGTLDIISTYTASAGDQVVLISAAEGYTGTFATTNLPSDESGSSWMIIYEPTEVILSLTPICFAPSNLIVDNLGGTYADISWTPGGNCALDGTYWVQSVQDPPPTIGVGGETFACGGTFPISITGLNAETSYNVYVSESCGTGNNVGPELLGSFTTCPSAFEWTGAEDNLWSNVNNWCQGVLPGVSDDVLIPAEADNDVMVDIDVVIKDLEYRKHLTINESFSMQVTGSIKYYADLTNNGTYQAKYFSHGPNNDSSYSSSLSTNKNFQNSSTGTMIIDGEGTPRNAMYLRESDFVNDGALELKNFPRPFSFGGSTNTGITLSVSSSFTNNGTIEIENFTSSWAYNHTSARGVAVGSGCTFTNNGPLSIDVQYDDIINDGTFVNNDLITINGGKGLYSSAANPTFTNDGTINVLNGTDAIFVSSSEWANAGTLQGQGLISGDMTNSGTLIPGQSPGIITYDDAFTNTGTIQFEVLGDEGAGEINGHDQLILNTDQNILGGTIDVTSTYPAIPGDQFVIISAAEGYTGTFATTNLPPNESGFSWVISYEATEVILSLGPLCYAPSDLVVDNVGETTADISWTPGGNCTLDGNYWVQPVGDPAPTTADTADPESLFPCGGTFPISVTGLTAGETYNVYVYESCGTGIDVGPELVGSFTTWIDCDPDGQFSLDFDGVNDYVDIESVVGDNTTSFECWFNAALVAGENRIISKSTGQQYIFNLAIINGYLHFYEEDVWMQISDEEIIVGEWNHLALSRVSATELATYLNGGLQSTITVLESREFKNQHIGASTANSNFEGQIDEFRVWDGPLSEADILARLNTELTGTETDLLAYYNFNDGNGNTILTDITGNGYDGTLTNMDPNSDWVCGFEPIPCLQASGLSTTDISGTTATANWATNGNTDFEVILGETGFAFGDEEMTFNVTGSSVEMTGLEEGKTYDWYVRADCDADGFSDYTGPETFTINNTTLDFSSNTNYVTHIVSPLVGLPEDLYRFEVKYTNSAGTLPTGAYPRLLIDEDGNGVNEQLVTMLEADAADVDVTDGKIYFVELTGFQTGDAYMLAVEDIKPNGYTTTLGPVDELEILQPVDVSIFAADIAFSNDNPDPSTQITVTATIRNESSFDATNFSASLFNEYDDTTYPNVNNINVLAGGTTDISWTITTPAEVAFVPMRVTIDIDDILVEPNELDNDAVRPFLNGPFIIGDAGINVVAELSVSVIDNVEYTTLTGTATYFGIPEQEDEPVAGGDVEFELVPLGTMYTTHTDNDGNFSFTFLTPSVGYNVEGTVTDLFFTGEFEVGPCLADLVVEIEEFDFANEDELHSFDVTFTNNGCLETSAPFTATVSMPDGIPTSINIAVPALGSTESYTESIEVTYNDFGDKTITVDADINEEIIESNEENNEDTQPIYVLCTGVDLRAQSVFYDPSFVTIDECGFYFNLPIRNFGITTSVETTAKVEKMKGAALISTEYYTIPPIASLGSHSISFFDIFESEPGNYSYVVTVDDSDDQVECIEDNQSATTSFDVIGCGRDLAIGYCYAQDVTTLDGMPGEIVTVSTLIRSIGGSDISEDFEVDFITADETVTVTHTGGLADGTTVTLTADLTIPNTGSATYSVVIDPDDTITELSENNNTYNGELNYDFFLTDFCGQNYVMFWEKLYTPFQPINMEIGLKNWGNLTASEVGVHFEVVAGPGITVPVDLGTAMVTNVERTCGCPKSVFLSNPASLSMTGIYTIRMTADSGEGYTESDESNNTYEVQIEVTSDPDFATESQFINPSELNPALDEEITFSMSYENLGETYLNPFSAKVEVDGIELETITVDGLIQNDDNTVAITTPWSSDLQGIHIVKWILDPLEELDESDETNNIATRLVLVGNAPNPTIIAFSVDNAGPDENEEINFQVVIDNEGDVDADMTLKLYYYDGSGILTEFYSGVHTSTADPDITIDIPWTVLETSTEILAEISGVDPQEYNEEDNTATLLLNGFDVDIAITHLTCTDAEDGELTATETGGIAPVTFLWNNGETTPTISGLIAGEYSVAVTDGLGVVVNETAVVIVDDSEAPVVTCADLTLYLNDVGTVALVSSDVSITDNCDDLLVPQFSQASFGCAHKGENVVTVTATDISGNVGECVMTVTVVDEVLPTITCPDPLTVNNDEDQCYATIEDLGQYIAADNCPEFTVENDAPTTFPVGETTVTWTVIDAVGNEAECTQMVTVIDNQVPTITCPESVSVTADTDACIASSVALGSPIIDDNCEGETATNDAPETYPIGITEVTWTVEDAAGLTATCVQIVTVTDDQFPTITCPSDIEVSVDADACTASGVMLGDAVGVDNCPDYTIDNDAPATYESGVTTVTWTITDASGNETTCEQLVTVNEDILPTISCPSPVTVFADAGTCTASVVMLGDPIIDDNCPGESASNDAPTTFPIGETTVTWTVIDAAGNEAECTQMVTVIDNQVPTITCPEAVNVMTDTDACIASSVALGSPITDDNCEGETATNDAPETYPIGITEVTWTVEDAAGLTATCVQMVTVTDDQFPTITCPSDIVVSVDEDACTASEIVLGDATGLDNCSFYIDNPEIFIEEEPGDSEDEDDNDPALILFLYEFPVGETEILWTAVDASGNETTCLQMITVVDDILPQITCPIAVTVFADAGACTASAVMLGDPIIDDNCPGESSSNDAPATFPVGETTVTWIVIDAAGNEAECTQLVTVIDNQVPMITCPEAVNVMTDTDACIASSVALGSPITDDNCEGETAINDAPETYPIGITEVTWTVEDAAGLTATCVQIVTVTDNQFPTITCPSDIVVSVDEDACTASGVILGDAVGADNCPDYTIDNDAPATYETGVTTVTWTITDASGNETTCEQLVTVNEDILPTIACPPTMNFTSDEGECFATVSDIGEANGFDNCGTFDITNNASTTFNIGETMVLWTITDAAGNEANCTQIITVVDVELPEITCPVAIEIPAEVGICGASTDGIPLPVYSDNCPTGLTVVNDAGSTLVYGENIITWTVSDAAGNEAMCTQMVTVVDEEDPNITCPDNVLVNADNNTCTAIGVELGVPVVTDNCEAFTVTNDAPLEYSVGVTVVIWTVEDVGGNVVTCEQLVTVVDVVDPEIICPEGSPITLAISLTATHFVVSGDEIDASTTDNCSVSITNDYNDSGSLSGASIPVGEHVIVWTAEDESGNTSMCTITVIVENSSCAPTFSLADGGDDCPLEQFYINVDITDLGLATSLKITNDGGAPTINSVGLGVYSVGPFNTSTTVEVTVTDEDDDTCFDSKDWTTKESCPDPNSYFITSWITQASSLTITIPTTGTGYDYDVDWGDGTDSQNHNGDAVHSYDSPGTYQVKILGEFPRIYFNNTGNIANLISVDQWGAVEWESMERAFYGCYALNILATDNPDLSKVTNMSEMFRAVAFFNDDIGNWDVSNVTVMKNLFRDASAFNQDLNNWDVSSVTRMDEMFFGATVYNQPMFDWDVSSVINMHSIFRDSDFDQDINGWDVSNVTNMSKAFRGTPFDYSLIDWDVSNVTTMREMFFNNIAFDQYIGDWDVSNVEDLTKMFAATSYNQDLSNWDVSGAEDMNGMFEGNGQFNQDVSIWDVSNVSDMNDMFNGSISFDQSLADWDMTSVIAADGMFDGVTLSTDNYDEMLIAWNEQNLNDGVIFSGGNSTYCNGLDARSNMVTNQYWTITDGGNDSDACELCTFIVINTDDAGEGSLRSAITCANNFPGPDTIRFDIPGVGPHTINLVDALPNMVDDSTVIDATTQLDNYPMDGQVIVDMTALVGANTVAMRIFGENSEIYGLDFKNYDTSGKQSALFYAFGSDDFILGDSLRGNWFTGDRYYTAVFTKENINGGTIQSNKFETVGDSIETAILINSGTNHILIGGEKQVQGNEFINCSYTAIELRNYASNNTISNNYFKHNDRAIFTNGDFLNGFSQGNEYWDNIYICNDTAIVNSPNGNLGIQPPTIEYSKINFVSGFADPGSIVEIYATADTCSSVNVICAGEKLIGRDSVDVDGKFYLLLDMADAIPLGYSVSATQTDTLSKGSSAFSECMPVDDDCVPFVYACYDNDIGSLRSAIDCAIDGETIYFLNFLLNENVMLEEALDIDKNITIEGLGNPGITVMSNANTSSFKIVVGKQVIIKDMALCVNDTGSDNIIDNKGDLTLDNVTIVDKRTMTNSGNVINDSGAVLNINNTVKIEKQ